MAIPLKAVVSKIVTNGVHGPFAVTTPLSEHYQSSITFAIEPRVWKEKRWPEPGEMVALSEIVEKPSGMRAKVAEYWKGPNKWQKAKSTAPREANIQESTVSRARFEQQSRFGTVSVVFADITGKDQRVQETNKLLGRASESERLQLFQDLFRLWVEGQSRYVEARSTFGDLFKMNAGKSLLFTLNTTSGGRQILKAWYDIPTLISSEEVSGSDVLLTIAGGKGSEEKIDQYLRSMLKVYPIRRNTIKNRVRVWMNWM